MLRVYDVDSGIDAMTAFYAYHLPDAKRVSKGSEVTYTVPSGYVRLVPSGSHARITFVIGPR